MPLCKEHSLNDRPMQKKKKNLSVFDLSPVQDAASMRIGILVSQWNEEVTSALLDGAIRTLKGSGVQQSNIIIHPVPGSFELSSGASMMAASVDCDAIICLGCIIQGETRHFEFIAQAVANGITDAGIRYGMPVIFGVLTTDTYEQAMARAGGKHGNKGDEAAMTALRMVELARQFTSSEQN